MSISPSSSHYTEMLASRDAFSSTVSSAHSIRFEQPDKSLIKANGMKAYQSATRNLSKDTLQTLDDELNKLAVDQPYTNDLQEALIHNNWKHAIFQDPKNYPYYALAALKEGKISTAQFSTIMFYWSIGQDCPALDIQSVCLFDKDGRLNQAAADFIKRTLIPSNGEYGSRPYLNAEQWEIFLQLMQDKSIPLSEKQFFIIPDPEGQTLSGDTTKVNEEIEKILGFNVLHHFRNDQQVRMRMVPSLSMMQAMLNAKHGPNAVTITPNLGLSPEKAIRDNALNDTRDLLIPFIEIASPKEADGYFVSKAIDFVFHDFYHAFLVSCVPSGHRKAFALIANMIEEMEADQTLKNMKDIITLFKEKIIDMEATPYRPEIRKRLSKPAEWIDSLSFWKSLEYNLELAIENSCGRFVSESNQTDPMAKMKMDYELKITVEALKKSQFLSRLFDKICSYKEEWQTNYGVLFELLADLVRDTQSDSDTRPHINLLFKEAFQAYQRHQSKKNLIIKV